MESTLQSLAAFIATMLLLARECPGAFWLHGSGKWWSLLPLQQKQVYTYVSLKQIVIVSGCVRCRVLHSGVKTHSCHLDITLTQKSSRVKRQFLGNGDIYYSGRECPALVVGEVCDFEYTKRPQFFL